MILSAGESAIDSLIPKLASYEDIYGASKAIKFSDTANSAIGNDAARRKRYLRSRRHNVRRRKRSFFRPRKPPKKRPFFRPRKHPRERPISRPRKRPMRSLQFRKNYDPFIPPDPTGPSDLPSFDDTRLLELPELPRDRRIWSEQPVTTTDSTSPSHFPSFDDPILLEVHRARKFWSEQPVTTTDFTSPSNFLSFDEPIHPELLRAGKIWFERPVTTDSTSRCAFASFDDSILPELHTGRKKFCSRSHEEVLCGQRTEEDSQGSGRKWRFTNPSLLKLRRSKTPNTTVQESTPRKAFWMEGRKIVYIPIKANIR